MKTYTNPQFPGKTFRRLEVGEIKQEGDYITFGSGNWDLTICAGEPTPEIHEMYREIPTEDRADLLLARINEVMQKLDAVLAKLND